MFKIEGNHEADTQTPMFGRGRLDHLALQAVSLDCVRDHPGPSMALGAADDFVTDFGPMLSLFFETPTDSKARCALRIRRCSRGLPSPGTLGAPISRNLRRPALRWACRPGSGGSLVHF